jgi:glutamate decarboxylase
VRHGVSRDLAELLLDDIRQALAYFDRHPDHAVLTPAEASGFHH